MGKPLSLYIHIPFCERKCPYCDFVSHVSGNRGEYVKKLCKEINSKKVSTHTVNTVYFGGGTPSLIDARFIAEILRTIRGDFNVAKDAEISIECNPNSLTEEKLAIYKKCGINRISIGVQSFCNKTLKVLGRIHSVKQAKNAIKSAGKYFDNISIDIIHSVPNCKTRLPQKYLRLVKHVSAYCLTSDKYPETNEEKSIKEQQKIEKILRKSGIDKYEVSNFARRGFESKHNLTYWTCGEWLGFGESAASHFNEPWTDSDKIMLGLRLTHGIPYELFKHKETEVKLLIQNGLLEIKDDLISCTPRGFLILNSILCKLI